jgi:hypothetical protein
LVRGEVHVAALQNHISGEKNQDNREKYSPEELAHVVLRSDSIAGVELL